MRERMKGDGGGEREDFERRGSLFLRHMLSLFVCPSLARVSGARAFNEKERVSVSGAVV